MRNYILAIFIACSVNSGAEPEVRLTAEDLASHLSIEHWTFALDKSVQSYSLSILKITEGKINYEKPITSVQTRPNEYEVKILTSIMDGKRHWSIHMESFAQSTTSRLLAEGSSSTHSFPNNELKAGNHLMFQYAGEDVNSFRAAAELEDVKHGFLLRIAKVNLEDEN